MTELIEKYFHIMDMYKKGEFGSTHLTFYEVLEMAKELDLFDKMSLSEIQYLIDNSSGITKLMFIELVSQKSKTNSSFIDEQIFDLLAIPCEMAEELDEKQIRTRTKTNMNPEED